MSVSSDFGHAVKALKAFNYVARGLLRAVLKTHGFKLDDKTMAWKHPIRTREIHDDVLDRLTFEELEGYLRQATQ